MSSVGEVTVDNTAHTVTVTINEADLSNISDRYETASVDFPVTALLFESNITVAITNRCTVSDGRDTYFGNLYGQWVSEAGISMPRNSHFVTIAIPNRNLTVTQKLVVDWTNVVTEEHGIAEYDLIVRIIPIT